jgi:hypothetical protein
LGRPRSKRPTGPTWQITADPVVVERHVLQGGNVGLVCHEETGLAVLDPDQLGPWADLVDELGQPGVDLHGEPADASVRTGSGRLHYYVCWVPNLPAKLPGGIGEVLRGPGQQQVTCPPSVHPETGDRYVWLVDPAAALPRLSADWSIRLQHDVFMQSYRARRGDRG